MSRDDWKRRDGTSLTEKDVESVALSWRSSIGGCRGMGVTCKRVMAPQDCWNGPSLGLHRTATELRAIGFFMCEGCLERPATQVHHLHYQRVFDECLFDLVAICDRCHAKCHPRKQAA